MTTAEITLEYLRVLLSGPPVAALATVVIAWVFRTQLRNLIARIAHVRLPGGTEFTASQQDQLVGDRIRRDRTPALRGDEATVNLPEVDKLEPAESARIKQLVESERTNAITWEYRFLNFYLVRTTQMVLDWLITRPPMSIRQFDTELMSSVNNATERMAIFKALENHHLLTVNGDLIEVTPKGKEYQSWRGPLPPLRTESSLSNPTESS